VTLRRRDSCTAACTKALGRPAGAITVTLGRLPRAAASFGAAAPDLVSGTMTSTDSLDGKTTSCTDRAKSRRPFGGADDTGVRGDAGAGWASAGAGCASAAGDAAFAASVAGSAGGGDATAGDSTDGDVTAAAGESAAAEASDGEVTAGDSAVVAVDGVSTDGVVASADFFFLVLIAVFLILRVPSGVVGALLRTFFSFVDGVPGVVAPPSVSAGEATAAADSGALPVSGAGESAALAAAVPTADDSAVDPSSASSVWPRVRSAGAESGGTVDWGAQRRSEAGVAAM